MKVIIPRKNKLLLSHEEKLNATSGKLGLIPRFLAFNGMVVGRLTKQTILKIYYAILFKCYVLPCSYSRNLILNSKGLKKQIKHYVEIWIYSAVSGV